METRSAHATTALTTLATLRPTARTIHTPARSQCFIAFPGQRILFPLYVAANPFPFVYCPNRPAGRQVTLLGIIAP